MQPRTVLFLLPLSFVLGCAQPSSKQPPASNEEAEQPELKKVSMGPNVWLETSGDKRRVLIDGYVCLREGLLEHLMCRRNTKEHEAILAADIDARDVHKALLLTGIEPGSLARYEPEYRPPLGPEIAIT